MTALGNPAWLVTGATRGIGLGLTRAHLERGGKVVATYRDQPSAELLELAASHPERLSILQFDQGRDASATTLQAARVHPIGVMIHNAGVFGPRAPSFQGLDLGAVGETIDVNALGVLRVTEAFLPAMQGVERPRIVAISSLMGTAAKAGSGHLAYRVSKAALNMIIQVMAAELAPQKVAMACLRPGPVRTQMSPNGKITPEESAAALLKVIDDLAFTPKPQFLDMTGEVLGW